MNATRRPPVVRPAWVSAAVVLTAPLAPPRAQPGYPMVSRVEPAAVQRGQTVEVTIAGNQDFSGASALLFEGTGLSAEVLAASSDSGPAMKRRGRGATGSVKAKLAVAA